MAKRISNTDTSEIIVPIITILSDVIAIECAFLLSYWLRFYSPLVQIFPFPLPIPQLSWYLILSVMVIPIWLLIFQSRKMYRPRRVVFIFDEFFAIVRLASFGIIFSFGLIFFYRVFPYSRLVFIFIWITSIILITIGRYIVLKFEKTLYEKGKALRSAIIIGNNPTGLQIFNNFKKHKYAGYNLLGFIEEDKFKGQSYLDEKYKLGTYSQIKSIIHQYHINTVFLSIPSTENDKLYEILRLCEGENVEFLLVPDFLEMITSSVRVQEINGIPFLKIKSIPMNIWNRMLKRIFDFTFALVSIIILSPLFIFIAILIKLTSKGPVFYTQERVTLAGIKFNMIKFRSMIHNAEKETGAVFVTKSDSRYTPVGEFLRKYSLDELPQLFNVLKGEMSIVGPRPEREYFINLLKDKIPKYLERHRVKCGLTGWAQVNGYRGSNSSLEKRIEYDIYYIENWSIVFDLKIIIKTIREVLSSKTAF